MVLMLYFHSKAHILYDTIIPSAAILQHRLPPKLISAPTLDLTLNIVDVFCAADTMRHSRRSRCPRRKSPGIQRSTMRQGVRNFSRDKESEAVCREFSQGLHEFLVDNGGTWAATTCSSHKLWSSISPHSGRIIYTASRIDGACHTSWVIPLVSTFAIAEYLLVDSCPYPHRRTQ